MQTPEELRYYAERLRELAKELDGYAGDVDIEMSDVERILDSGGSDGSARIWSGPAPDELEQKIRTWIVDAADAAQQLAEYAHMCRTRADKLEDDAATLQEENEPAAPQPGGN